MEKIIRKLLPKKIADLVIKNQSFLIYVFFGVVTTIVNIVTYHILYNILHISNVPSNLIAWVVAVAVAYVTNRKWVFQSAAKGFYEIFTEIIRFILARLFSLGVDTLIMWVSVDVMGMNALVWKIIANVVTIIINYILSKLLVFKDKK